MATKFNEFNINEYIERERELKTKKTSNRLAKISDFSKKVAQNIQFDEIPTKKKTRLKVSVTNLKKRKATPPVTAAGASKGDWPEDNVDDDPDYEDDDFKHNLPEVKDDSDWNVFQRRLECSEPDEDFVELDEMLKAPESVWNRLFKYQQEGVKWLWRLHREKTGGLLGDEMGLGKTVQIIAFLAALTFSKIREFGNIYVGLGPTLILCPSTVLFQWLDHFHDWGPFIRVAIFHHSINNFTSNYQRKALIKSFNEENGVIITTYQNFLSYTKIFEQYQYHYLILDEGHKIKNPQAKVTIAVKNLRCEHRIVLTASPIQNSLKELWSLFDFIAPQKLAKTLQEFTETIEQPIVQSEYKNATLHEEKIGMNKTLTLKSLIDRHILRRTVDSADVHLPEKHEQILFCSLTDEQKDLYEGFLTSEHVRNILGNTNMYTVKFQTKILTAITILRKICNHPCLYLEEAYAEEETFEVEEFANFQRSGKMVLLDGLLQKWSTSDRVLLFTQSRKMIDFLEYYLTKKRFKYLKMDGSTAVATRKNLINSFNNDKSVFVFLLTTRVGGLGINLTGANKVVIFDPDWNPAIDLQAKERACRIGQKKSVEIFRLISKGTIEEKIYQRQIWKQLISNKVLLNTKNEKIFKKSDLFDLFHLTDNISDTTEVLVANLNKSNAKRKRTEEKYEFSTDQINQMRKLAKKLSDKLIEKTNKSKL